MRILIFMVLGLCLTSPGWAQSKPVLIQVPEAIYGPPRLSCEQAIVISSEDQETRDPVIQPTDPVAVPPDAPERVDTVEVPDNGRLKIRMFGKIAADMPGGRPEEIPVRGLEGAEDAIAAVSQVMDRAEAGARVRISVYGASHTGADFFTGHLRRLLQRRYGDLGHGFIFPAALYTGYRGSDINLCRSDGWKTDWVGRSTGRGDGLHGFAGASVSSADPADFGWLETTHTNINGRVASTYDIFTLAQPGGGTLLVTVDEAPPRAIFTESSELGMLWHRLEVPPGPHRLMVQPIGDGEVRIFGISAEADGPGVLVDAMGIRGRKARTWLFWEPEMARQGLEALDPDMVVLAYGTNEAADSDYRIGQYREDLRKVLTMMRRGAPQAACVLVGPTDRGGWIGRHGVEIWKRTAQVAQVQREVGTEFGCVFWDWQEATGGEGSIAAWRLTDPRLSSKDLIHLTQAGYEWSAERFLQALDQTASSAH